MCSGSSAQVGFGFPGFKIGAASSSFHGGGIDQTTGSFVAYGKNWGVRYENDWMFDIPIADGGDRWRTTGVAITVGDYSLNTHFVTGDPDALGRADRPYDTNTGIYHDRNGSTPDMYRIGSLTLGYKGTFAGWNSERIRHLGQNRFAHDFLLGGESKHFRVMPNAPYQGFYTGHRRPNFYTTW